MNKMLFIITVFVFSIFGINLNAQTPYFYYYKSEKQYLNLDTQHIFVSFPDTATVKVLLYSHSTTQLVYSKDFSASEQQIKIDTSKLPNGIYYLNIIANGEKVKQQTIVVNH